MDKPLPAYRGDEPYVFVSYSHDDEALAYREIRWLQDQGVRVFYDEGISPGSEWSEALAQAITGSEAFLYFITPRSIASENCRRELVFAQTEGCPVLAVHLQETEIPPGVRLSLGNRQAILAHRMDPHAYRQALLDSIRPELSIPTPAETPAARRSPKRGLTLLTASVALLLLVAWWLLKRDEPSPALNRMQFNSIAVLPFADASPGRELERLAPLTTRQLVTRLDELPTLHVSSTAAVQPLLERKLSLPELARELGVAVVLTGYLQRDGDFVEVSVEIVRAGDGRMLWSQTLRRPSGDQALTARFVAGELARFLGAISTLTEPGPATPEAYRAWLNWHFHQANYRNWEEVKWIEQVIRLEPTYPPAHLNAFLSYHTAALDGQDVGWIGKAKDALDAARAAGLERDPRFLWCEGLYFAYLIGDLDRGERKLRASGYPSYAQFLTDSGVAEPALAVFESLTAQNPFVAGAWLGLGFARGMRGDLDGALAAYEGGLRRSPDDPYLLLNHSRALIFLGRYEEAERSLERLESLEPLPPGSHLAARGNRLWLAARRGDAAEALSGAEGLAAEGWHAMAGQLFLELDDPRAAEQYELAAQKPVAGRRMITSWLHPKPAWKEHPIVRRYLESLGYTDAWRREACIRAVGYAAGFGVELRCQ